MNLEQLKEALGDLYPQLRTRSGQKITTHEATGKLTEGGLAVLVKTLFPPSARRRTEFVVTSAGGGLDIRPLDPAATSDASRFAELLRERWVQAEPAQRFAPLRLIKDGEGRYCFRVGLTDDVATTPATPAALRNSEKGSH